MKPPSGGMIWWKARGTTDYKFGYVTYLNSYNLIRLGRWNGDTAGGYVVDFNDIEWKKY